MGWPVAMPVAVRALHRWRRPGHQVDQAPWSRPLQSRYQAAHAGWNGALVLSCSMHIVSLPLSSLAHAERTRHGETRDSAGDHIACPGVRQNTRPRQSRTVLTGASACRSGPLSPSGRPQILHPTAGSRLSKDDVCIFHGPELCGRDGAASRENWYIHPRPRPSPFVLANQHNVLFQRAFADQRQASPVRFPHAIISCI